VLGDRDAFPALDLGILRALQALLANPKLGAPEALQIAERWRPWRAYACFQLWGSLADAPR
jgi:AraC family transcriptional regulator, regulatory protein of adaptative response / DNA-3-methyladenine glycosylase II